MNKKILITALCLTLTMISCGEEQQNTQEQVPIEVQELQDALNKFENMNQVLDSFEDLKEQMVDVSNTQTE